MDAAADQFGDREAYVDGDRRCTFGEWIAAADTAAADLVAAGVHPGDVVAITLPPSLDYAIAYAAVVRAGAVATGLNTRLGPRGRRDRGTVAARGGDQRAAGGRRPVRSRRPPPATVTRRSRRHHLDERDDGAAEGRVVRPPRARGRGRNRWRHRGAIRPPARCHAVRARRLHGQALGAARVGHHRRHHPAALVGRRDGSPPRIRAHHRRRRRADAVGQGRRPPGGRNRRPLVAPPLPRRDRARPARAGQAHRASASGARSSSATR